MEVTTTQEARAFIAEHGGELFVWSTDHSCCGGRLTLLDSATDPPAKVLGRHFDRIDGGGFALFLSAGRRALPEELVVELRGIRRRRVEAYWNGCAYVT